MLLILIMWERKTIFLKKKNQHYRDYFDGVASQFILALLLRVLLTKYDRFEQR